MKGRKPSDVPASRLGLLNTGKVETEHLAEWLAVDMADLLRAVLPALGLANRRSFITSELHGADQLGVTARLARIGSILFEATERDWESSANALAGHRSDVVRQWGAYVVAAVPLLALPVRLNALRRFAADQNMSVRECAWMAFRPFLAAELEVGLDLLQSWSFDNDARIRRFASEVSRPRGVWCAHIKSLKKSPELGLPLLEPLRADPHLYVRRSVGNWLNDASKSAPAWVRATSDRWLRESDNPATRQIVRRGLRTLAGVSRSS